MEFPWMEAIETQPPVPPKERRADMVVEFNTEGLMAVLATERAAFEALDRRLSRCEAELRALRHEARE